MSYTKTPWLQAENDATFIYALNDREVNQFWLKLYGQAEGAGEKELIANANLIVAAPELLEALKDALSGWRYIRETHGDLYGVGWGRVQEKLEQAIAKAEGGSDE